jgi:hypothetical protein
MVRKRSNGEEAVKAEGRSDKEAVIKAEGMKTARTKKYPPAYLSPKNWPFMPENPK